MKCFVRSRSIDYRFRGLPGVGFGVGLVTGSCHSLGFFCFCFPFSLLAIFVSPVVSFFYDVRVRGVVSMFNVTAHSFFVWGSS